MLSRICGASGRGAAAVAKAMLPALRAGAVDASAWREGAREALAWTGRAGGAAAHDDRWSVVLDGTVFNRKELGGSGDDAALLLSLVSKRGFPAALESLNGDFAVAAWDAKDQALWLGRDRFGVRPLYWAAAGGLTAFASRPRALFALPGLKHEPRREYLALFAGSHYRTFDTSPKLSPYEGIFQVEAGSWLKVDASGKTSEGRYWTLTDQGDLDEPEDKLAERYRALLLDATGLRVKAGAGHAFTLSGGMDSSSVLACAVRETGRKQRAFSTTYEDATYDETAEIRTMLDSTVETWTPVRLGTPDVPSLVAKMVEAHDEPVATATWLSHYTLCDAVRKEGFSRLFGGLGGDELNAGEYEYFFFFFADLAAAGDEALLLRETAAWVKHHDHPIFKKNEAVMRDGLARLADLSVPGKVKADRRRLERYAKALSPAFYDLKSFTPPLDAPFGSWLKNRTWHDLFLETLPCCLRAQDRHGAAFGLEHLLPFLDHRLVELMFRVPSRLKIRDGVTKYLLRSAMKGILPEETRTRVKKTGWNAPAHVWFSGKGRELVGDLVASREFRERGIYDAAEVRRLADEHERIVSSAAAEDNHMMFFWQLVNLELWLRSLGRRPTPDLV